MAHFVIVLCEKQPACIKWQFTSIVKMFAHFPHKNYSQTFAWHHKLFPGHVYKAFHAQIIKFIQKSPDLSILGTRFLIQFIL